MSDVPEDSVGYDQWYDNLRRRETGGTDITLEQILARRDQILQLAIDHGIFNLRLVGDILHRPLEPAEHIQFLADWDRRRAGSGLAWFAFPVEVEKLLWHYVTVERTTPATEIVGYEAVAL